MNCQFCRDLERTYEAVLSEYTEARSSALFQVCLDVAAQKKVEMERARYEPEEHRLVCGSAGKTVAHPRRAFAGNPGLGAEQCVWHPLSHARGDRRH